MAIDFFKATCQCNISNTEFGIVDLEPAVISFEDSDNWNVTICNPSEKEIIHTAIDNCLDIPFEEGERCDSMLTFDNTLIFIEIKERNYGRWAGEAKNQLINTIAIFKRDCEINNYKRFFGQIANKKKPYFRSGLNNFSQSFEDETGFILRVSSKIVID